MPNGMSSALGVRCAIDPFPTKVFMSSRADRTASITIIKRIIHCVGCARSPLRGHVHKSLRGGTIPDVSFAMYVLLSWWRERKKEHGWVGVRTS